MSGAESTEASWVLAAAIPANTSSDDTGADYIQTYNIMYIMDSKSDKAGLNSGGQGVLPPGPLIGIDSPLLGNWFSLYVICDM